jgi:selenide,water dikinase
VFGAIAAANSLSDVYAMGGTPITAMAITCFPEKGVDFGLLAEIMTGGAEKLHEAGVALIGGHSVADKEIKFGYSITGLIHPNHVLTNAGAIAGDALILTKPLGIGLISSGIKLNRASPEATARAIELMSTLNRSAAEAMLQFEVHSATDITGNGLLGHAYEMATASRVTLRFESSRVPYLSEAYAIAEAKILPRTIATTWKMIEETTLVAPGVAEALLNILLDPQTSGGLLISVHSRDLESLLSELAKRGINGAHVGGVESLGQRRIVVD